MVISIFLGATNLKDSEMKIPKQLPGSIHGLRFSGNSANSMA
ncbi:MAG: hypothetical protein WCP08_16925 [Prolixibacteraceae bacterium]